MRRLAYWSVLIGVGVGLLQVESVLCSVAFAQGAPPPPGAPPVEKPLAETLHDAAKQEYLAAKALFRNNDFAGAATKFAHAYELSKDPRLLFDKAICEKNLRAFAQMQKDLEKYEQESGPSIPPQHKAAADEAIAAIKNFVGSVTLRANVEGATVTVDGEGVGQTPLRAPIVLDPGKHRIEVTKAGFGPAGQELEIEAGRERSVELGLVQEAAPGHLLVIAEAEATIVIDGAVVGTERFDGPVPSGVHDVKVTEPGKVTYDTQIELHDRETRTLQVTLESESHSVGAWPWVVGGAVLAAGAVTAGYFVFKSSPEEVTPIPRGTLGGGSGDIHTMTWRGP